MARGEVQQYYADLLIETLTEAGGRLDSGSGLAQSTLVKAAGLTTGQASPVIARLVDQGALRRERKGKRVYWIELVEKKDDQPEPEDPPASVPEPVEVPLPAAAVGGATAAEVAVALLDHVLDLIERPKQVAIDSDRLNYTVAENNRLQARLRDAEDRIRSAEESRTAMARERDGLRQRIQKLEANLKAATTDVKHVVDEEVRRRLAEFMQERPHLRALKGDEK